MKSYNHIMEQIVSYENISKAIDRSSLGKRKKKDVRYCLTHKDKVIKRVQEILLSGTFKPPKHKLREINDGIKQKKRVIAQPFYMYEQIIHHAIVQVISPHIERSSYIYSCGSMPGRGATHGKKYLEKFIKKHPKDCKYVLKLDIHHYFQSIDHDILMDMIRKKYHDERFCDLMYRIIDNYHDERGRGLPIGFYTSQWIANWYLQDVDFYIKHDLGAVCYVRYMDDLVILGRNKKVLHDMRRKIELYLLKHKNLYINNKWQVFRLKERPLDFMGFRFHRTHTTLRRTIMLRATRKARRMSHVTWYNSCQMISYLGWFKHCNVYGIYKEWIKPHISARALKKRLSTYQRRLNCEINLAKEREYSLSAAC